MATDFQGEEDFPPDILAAFAEYPTPSPSRGFTERFWAQWETRRGRYRGIVGLLRRVWELEIEGVAVWRLAASTVTGGVLCALLFSVFLGQGSSKASPLPSPLPNIPNTSVNAYAFYNRDWENDFGLARTRPHTTKTRIQPRGGEVSWNGSNGHLA